jgi:RCC1 and BTB domain-containing protein
LDVACGENFVSALNTNGEVYTWGGGEYGQLGHGNTINLVVPKKVEELKSKIVAISSGESFSG